MDGLPVLFHVFSEYLIKSLYIVRVHLNFPLPVARGAIEDISTPSVPADPAAVGAVFPPSSKLAPGKMLAFGAGNNIGENPSPVSNRDYVGGRNRVY